MISLFIVLFVCAFFGERSAVLECDPADEISCDDGECISKMIWCDTIVDCSDGSDEEYCDGVKPCGDHLFPCRSGRCVPLSAVCDNYHHCLDGSDEENCEAVNGDVLLSELNSAHLTDIRSLAVVKATEYLLKQRNADYNWDAFTPRAVIALSFASRVSTVAENEKQLMQKQLDVQLLLNLMQNEHKMSLSSLAVNINALYATCQDPRNFHGIDLVARLRSGTDTAIRSNSSTPLALLTLCIAGDMKPSDVNQLAMMYYRNEFHRTGSKALIVMAMVCLSKTGHHNLFHNYISNFFSSKDNQSGVVDIYTKALFMQASIAVGIRPVATNELLSRQLPDGSFGDMLATYYAIPVLLNSNLLELRCNSMIKTGVSSEDLSMKSGGTNHVTYSLWISTGKDVDSHSLTLSFDGDKTFYEIMLMAAARDPLYRFSFDETTDGKMVYSLASTPNDIESGRQWYLFHGTVGGVVVNSVDHLALVKFGVDKIPAENQDHFVYWFKRQ